MFCRCEPTKKRDESQNISAVNASGPGLLSLFVILCATRARYRRPKTNGIVAPLPAALLSAGTLCIIYFNIPNNGSGDDSLADLPAEDRRGPLKFKQTAVVYRNSAFGTIMTTIIIAIIIVTRRRIPTGFSTDQSYRKRLPATFKTLKSRECKRFNPPAVPWHSAHTVYHSR